MKYPQLVSISVILTKTQLTVFNTKFAAMITLYLYLRKIILSPENDLLG